jgi:metal-sulfur cluster biosynthetic enzyme
VITASDIYSQLNAIVDPCSVAAGLPAGLLDMGLVREVDIVEDANGGARVSVVIAVTEYGCLMGAPFAQMACERLLQLPGVKDVDVKLDAKFDWSTADMDPKYQAALVEHRKHRRREVLVKIVQRDQRSATFGEEESSVL